MRLAVRKSASTKKIQRVGAGQGLTSRSRITSEVEVVVWVIIMNRRKGLHARKSPYRLARADYAMTPCMRASVCLRAIF